MDWEVGNTSNNNTIDILHPDAFERYSSHKKLEFDSILKHEMAHVYVQEMTNKKYIPYWLNEGLAMYLADQIHKYTENGYFIEKDFTSKLSSEYDWDKRANNDAYAISCLFTNYLVKTYSLDKVLDFIMHLDKNFYEPLFNKKFQNTFGASLTNVENEFAIKINN